MSFLVAILGLALLIIVHEAGHLLVARLCGMRVERFSVGFGKPLVSFKRGETIYQIAWVPLGGFVQITGLNPHEEFNKDDPNVYPNRPAWMRLAVLVAGPGANYLAAVIMAFVMLLSVGKETANVVADVVAGTPAQAVGLQRGDYLLEANGKVLSADLAITDVVQASNGQPVLLKVKRGQDIKTISVTPRRDPKDSKLRIGIQVGGHARVTAGRAVKEAFILPAVYTGQILTGMYEMLVGKQPANLSGPVGIARHMAKAAELGAMEFVRILMLLSVYLGIFNLLPLPALDGGRVLFLGINALPIKQVSAKTEAAVHMVGLLLLLGVFVLVTFKDIKEAVLPLFN
jgi:regulator of sigma E protease